LKTYPQVLEYLYSQLPMYHRTGPPAYKPGLDTTLSLCLSAGNPHTHFPSVHIAGTNGKGSVSSMLASVLMESGLRTALFTSPHLKDYRERIRVNGRMIPKSFVVSFVNRHQEVFRNLKPSFFEMTFAMAAAWFAEAQAEIAVIETGMGGRLDSTNVIRPLLSIITNIGMDHMQFLGDNPEAIASEKAGIIKPGVPVIIGESQEAIRHIFEDRAHGMQAPISYADRGFGLHSIRQLKEGFRTAIYKRGEPFLENLYCPLGGHYQQKNLLSVLEACHQLSGMFRSIPDTAILRGIGRVVQNSGLRGRWQVLKRKPLTICDTAHNESGISEVVKQLGEISCKRLHIVFGLAGDKDVSSILKLLPSGADYYFCRPDVPRGLPVEALYRTAKAAGLKGIPYKGVGEAYRAALSAASAEDLIFIGGSSFVVAEVV